MMRIQQTRASLFVFVDFLALTDEMKYGTERDNKIFREFGVVCDEQNERKDTQND